MLSLLVILSACCHLQLLSLLTFAQLLNHENGSDAGMYNEGFFQGDIFQDYNDAKNAVSNHQKLWPNGVVVFKVADDVGCPDSRQCKITMYAMEEYHRNTCIRFKEWTGEIDFVEIFYNDKNSGACWSLVGRTGGRQRLSLGFRCWYLGIAVHELGHALGFWHEMNRPDRDNYIRILWKNILPGFTSAFVKNSQPVVNNLGESFDLKSIMMYDEYAFSKDGKSPTIETKSGAYIGPIWKKPGLSDSDQRRIQKLYKCTGSQAKNGFPYDFNCNFTSHTCGFKNREKVIWKWKQFSNRGGYMLASGNKTTHFSDLISANFHGKGEAGREVMNGCLTVYYYIYGTATLKIKQEILKSVTDVSQGHSNLLWSSMNRKGAWIATQINLDVGKPYRDCQKEICIKNCKMVYTNVKLTYTVAFVPNFNGSGAVALKNITVTFKGCSLN